MRKTQKKLCEAFIDIDYKRVMGEGVLFVKMRA